jgi:hypothetical protein
MLRNVKSTSSQRIQHAKYRTYYYTLCRECKAFLGNRQNVRTEAQRKDASSWKNTWPSLLWNLLSGKEACSGRSFHDIYSAEQIWKFIPESLHGHWRDVLKRRGCIEFNKSEKKRACPRAEPERRRRVCRDEDIFEDDIFVHNIDIDYDAYAWMNNPGSEPEPFFDDRTADRKDFEDGINTWNLTDLLRVLESSFPELWRSLQVPSIPSSQARHST